MKQFTIPVYLGISPEMILGFASCVWIKSLTRSIGAVAVFAIEPETPPAAKSLKKPSGSCLYYDTFGMRERKIESKPFEQSERKKKKKKEIRSLSDDDDVLLLAGDLSHASETPTFGRTKEDFGGRKRDVDRSLSLVRSLSNAARSFREERTHLIIFWRP